MRKFGMWLGTLLLTLLIAAEASAQRRVTGRVVSTGGEPIATASVNVQGTTLGTYTAEDGRFTLANVPGGAQVLVVRRLGYKRVNRPLTAVQDEVEIRLEKDVLELERQVVTGTTTSISSANSANAISQVSAEQLMRTPTPTVENALQGKIRDAVISTGLNSISNAGTRGAITSSQDQQPNRISDLNPGDIESIEVLKGASAGAIYGSVAANGVILIRTKRGTTGAPVINASQRFGKFQLS